MSKPKLLTLSRLSSAIQAVRDAEGFRQDPRSLRSKFELTSYQLDSRGWTERELNWFTEPGISHTKGTIVKLRPTGVLIYRRFDRHIVGKFTDNEAVAEIRGLLPFFGTGPGQDPCDYRALPETTVNSGKKVTECDVTS